MPIHCPSCTAIECEPVGPIPDSSRFAGTLLPRALPGGTLYRCAQCALWFRHPRLPASIVNRLYAAGSEQAWASTDHRRPDWTLAMRLLRRHKPTGKVLDVGCFDGELLTRLGAQYQRFGVEMNPVAARRARIRGVTLLGQDFQKLQDGRWLFDVVIATDVVEHMPDPLAFLRQCARLTAPGGLLLVSTGSTDAWTWRLMKGAYWYCANAEHLCFLNEKWVRRAATELSLETIAIKRFAHDPSPTRALRQLLMNLIYRFAPRTFARARKRFARDPDARERTDLCHLPPSWSTAKDHMLFALRVA